MCVEDSDFIANFDGTKWTVQWKWKAGEPVLRYQCGEYSIRDGCHQKYDMEIKQRISDRWLEPHDEKLHGEVSAVIPVMAVLQTNNARKIRPVMDYSRELNRHVNCNPGNNVAICQEKLRE